MRGDGGGVVSRGTSPWGTLAVVGAAIGGTIGVVALVEKRAQAKPLSTPTGYLPDLPGPPPPPAPTSPPPAVPTPSSASTTQMLPGEIFTFDAVLEPRGVTTYLVPGSEARRSVQSAIIAALKQLGFTLIEGYVSENVEGFTIAVTPKTPLAPSTLTDGLVIRLQATTATSMKISHVAKAPAIASSGVGAITDKSPLDWAWFVYRFYNRQGGLSPEQWGPMWMNVGAASVITLPAMLGELANGYRTEVWIYEASKADPSKNIWRIFARNENI